MSEYVRKPTLEEQLDGLGLFEGGDDPPLVMPHQPMERTRDTDSSREAAAKIRGSLGKIQREVIEAYRRHGAMTFTQAEELPEFSHYRRSTVQKRVSELSQVGILELVSGEGSAVYRLNESRIGDPLPVPLCPTCHRVWRKGVVPDSSVVVEGS